MSVKPIKGKGVSQVDAMRSTSAFTDSDRHKLEEVYKSIRASRPLVSRL